MAYLKPITIIFAWNDYEEAAFNIQQNVKFSTGQCFVVASYDKPKIKFKDWFYIGESSYYTEQWNKALELFRSANPCNTLVQIQADAKCEDWNNLFVKMESSYERFKWGVYSPYVDFSGHYPPTEFVEHTFGYRSIKRTDCTVWAINEMLLHQGVHKFNWEKNKIGWGIDKYYCDLSTKSKQPIILDYNVQISHPKSSNYDHEQAITQSELMTADLNSKPLLISLCTTCSNRIDDLRYTLPFNIKFIEEYKKPVEWVIVDYGSEDPNEIKDLVESIKPIENLTIRYYRKEETWNIGRAKNCAHNLAYGDILVNLDADNFLGLGYLDYLHETFTDNILSVVYFKWDEIFQSYRNHGQDLGFMGKIAVSRGIFKSTGGYPNDLSGYGGDDTDFINRICLLPINHVTLNDQMKYWTKTIPNIDQHKIESDHRDSCVNNIIVFDRIRCRQNTDYFKSYKDVELLEKANDTDDTCLYELYSLAVDHKMDINDAIMKWSQTPGNKLKRLWVETIWNEPERMEFNNINEFNHWFTATCNIINNKIGKPKRHQRELLLLYNPVRFEHTRSDIIAVTSLSNKINHLVSQPYCLKTWKKCGLKIYSVNTKEEIISLKNKYPEVDEWVECNELSKAYTNRTQRINNLLQVSIDTNKNILLINSDIEIYPTEFTFDCFPGIGIRNNYDVFYNISTIEQYGIDVYFLTPEIIKEIPQTEFAIGRPFWDYWLVYIMEKLVTNIKVVTDSFYHKNHPQNWNEADKTFGFNYMAEHHGFHKWFDWSKWRKEKGYLNWNNSVKH